MFLIYIKYHPGLPVQRVDRDRDRAPVSVRRRSRSQTLLNEGLTRVVDRERAARRHEGWSRARGRSGSDAREREIDQPECRRSCDLEIVSTRGLRTRPCAIGIVRHRRRMWQKEIVIQKKEKGNQYQTLNHKLYTLLSLLVTLGPLHQLAPNLQNTTFLLNKHFMFHRFNYVNGYQSQLSLTMEIYIRDY